MPERTPRISYDPQLLKESILLQVNGTRYLLTEEDVYRLIADGYKAIEDYHKEESR